MYLYCKDKLTMDSFLQPGNVKERGGKMGIVPVVLHHSTVCEIATIQINMPNNHREDPSCKTIELMYFEIMKRFNYGKDLKTLHPIQDMEIEHTTPEDGEPEQMDIKKLVEA